MDRVIKFAKLIRRNWKKSTLFFGVIAYGSSYGFERYQTFQMMRAYCEEAKTFGEKTIPRLSRPKHVTVILNPESNKRKAKIQFEKFVSPLLHLAGFKVSVVQTENPRQAQELMEIMSNTDAVLVAGGDGTVQEAVTGWMKRSNHQMDPLPIGVLPLGRTNTLATHLFGSRSSSPAQLMAEAAMAVIREATSALDVLKIQYSGQEDAVYGMCSFDQGAFADVEQEVHKYWYLGALKDKFTYLIKSFKAPGVVENASLVYLEPCEGCSRCTEPTRQKEVSGARWWAAFMPRAGPTAATDFRPDLSKVDNPSCGIPLTLEAFYSNLSVFSSAGRKGGKAPAGRLYIKTYPKHLPMHEFVLSGLNHRRSRLEDSRGTSRLLAARELRIQVLDREDILPLEESSYIDNEKYPRGSCVVSILPKHVLVYS